MHVERNRLARIALALCAAAVVVAAPPARAQIVIDIDAVPGANRAGTLSVQRVELTFANGQPRATVGLNAALRAQARITYLGNGPLTGQWLVDGQPLQAFNRTLTFGDTVTLETAATPPLPTLQPGTHEVSLRLTTPAVAFTMPVIRYTVESVAGGAALTLVTPADNATLTRPRRDSLPIAQIAGAPRSTPLAFTWRDVPNFSPRLTRGAPPPVYRWQLFRAGQETTPVLQAEANATGYTVPDALASTLEGNRDYRWRVQALAPSGAVIATSETRGFRLLPPTPIDLRAPAEGAGADLPVDLRWVASTPFANYRVLAYLNDAALVQDVTALFAPARRSGASLAVFDANVSATSVPLASLNNFTPQPGLQLRWLVLGYDARGRIAAASEVGTFALSPPIATLNGLPVALQMAGFEIAVEQYATGAVLDNLSGRGSVRFARDATRTPIPLDFAALAATPFREQTREVRGSGVQQTVVVREALKARVDAGSIAQAYPTPVLLRLNDHVAGVRGLRLRAGAGGGARGDLALVLRGYTDATAPVVPATGGPQLGSSAPGPLPLVLPFTDIALEPGGDFFEDLGLPVGSIRPLGPAVAGLSITSGRLVADFSTARDATGIDGQPVRREGAVILANAGGELAAGALFPVRETAGIVVRSDAIELAPAGFAGTLRVTQSDTIQPILPAGYQLRFRAGAFSIAEGAIAPDSIFLDGDFEPPGGVRLDAGTQSTVAFTGMRATATELRASSVPIGRIEWGGAGSNAYRMVNARGDFRLPFAVAGTAARAGLVLTQGALDAPLRLVAEQGATPPAPAATLPQLPSVQTGRSSSLQEALRAPGGAALEPEELVDLAVGVAGVSGQIKSKRTHRGQIGDFEAQVASVNLTFVDSVPTASRLDGALVVPYPADFRLDFTGATATATGELLGPTLVAPTEIALAWWRSRLLLPARSTATHQPLLLAAATGLEGPVSDVALPLLLAAARDEAPGTAPARPSLPAGTIRDLRAPPAAPAAPPVLVLDRSFVRVHRARLRFDIDAQRFGPGEFEDLPLDVIEIGADGQVRNATLSGVNTSFMGRMPFAAESPQALRFEPGGGEPAPSARLVSMSGVASFPHFGGYRMTLAHTPSGARVDDISPTQGSGVHGDPKLLHLELGALNYRNGYVDGKGQFKEFLGLSQISVLEAVNLVGLASVGADQVGLYERVGLGIGVDPVRAVMLYLSGPISVGVKIGAGAINVATGGKTSAVSETTQLVGSAIDLATESTPAGVRDKLLTVLTDALALTRRIHRDVGGREDDEVGTGIAVAGIALNAVTGLTKAEADSRKVALAVLDALDLALAKVSRLKVDGRALPNDATNTLAMARFAAKGVRAYVDDEKFTKAEWVEVIKQLLDAVHGFSTDPGYRLGIEVLRGLNDVASLSDRFDAVVAMRLMSRTLQVVAGSTLVTGEPRDALVLSRALIEGLILARDMPNSNRVLAVAGSVLDAAVGPDTHFGGGTAAADTKKHLKMARRVVDLVGQAGAGIEYADAARMVQTTLHETIDTSDRPYVTVDGLVSAWAAIEGRPLTASLGSLETFLRCDGADADCASTEEAVIVVEVVNAALAATTPVDLLAALHRLKRLWSQAATGGWWDEFTAAYDETRRGQVRAKVEATIAQVLQTRLAARNFREFTRHSSMALSLFTALRDGWSGDASDLEEATAEVDIMGFGPGTLQQVRRFIDQDIIEIQRAPTMEAMQPFALEILGIERQFALLGVETPSDWPDGLAAVMNKGGQWANQASYRLQHAQTLEEYQTNAAALLGIERQRALLGADDDGNVPVTANILDPQGLVQRLVQQRINTARTSTELQAGIRDLLSLERQRQLLGAVGEGEERVVVPDSLFVRYDTLLRGEMEATLRATGASIKEKYAEVRGRLETATRLEDADGARALHVLLNLGQPPAGYTEAERDEQKAALGALLNQRVPALHRDALSRMRTAPLAELPSLVARYFDFESYNSSARDEYNTLISGWVKLTETIGCGLLPAHLERLRSPATAYYRSYKDLVGDTVGDAALRCAKEEAAQQTALVLQQYESGRGTRLNALSEAVKEIRTALANRQPEALLKERLAWVLAETVRDLTEAFEKAATPVHRTLWNTHSQAKYVVRFRRASINERVEAAVRLISEPLLGQEWLDPPVREEIQRIADGLIYFAKQGGILKDGLDMALDLVAGLGASHLAPVQPKAAVIVLLAREAINEARKEEHKSAGDAALSTLPFVLMAGYVLAEDAITGGLSGAFSGIGGWADENIGKPIEQTAQRLTPQITAVLALWDLYQGTQKETPLERLEAVVKFLERAPQLAVIGPYVRPLLRPERHLLAPDRDQLNFLGNLLLAELAAVRNDNPAHVAIGFKATCPQVKPDGGIDVTAVNSPDALFVCAIDVAREAIGGRMQAVLDPNSIEGIRQLATTTTRGMQQNAVYARGNKGDVLSGISGMLEYRGGQFSGFEFLATFGIQGWMETGTQVRYDEASRKLVIQLASVDHRSNDLLTGLGLSAVGVPQLWNSSFFQNPVGYFRAEIGGPQACVNAALRLVFQAPMIGFSDTKVIDPFSLCFDPFSLDITVRQPQSLLGVMQSEARMRLFFGAQGAGLEIDQTAGLYVEANIPFAGWVGVFVDARATFGVAGQATGLEGCGDIALNAGKTAGVSGPSQCPGTFVPDNYGAPQGPGKCREALSAGAATRAGTDYRAFFLKAQAGLDLGLVYLGGWMYFGTTVDGGVMQKFPTDRYGGFNGVTTLGCGRI